MKTPANRLEVISRNVGGGDGLPPLLFVHGAWHGAWCFDEGFLEHVAGQGFEVHAMSLRGHGNSAGRNRLHFARVRDFVNDVEEVADSLRSTPIIVGHSVGGFLIQKLMERRRLPGAVLLASAPPEGIAKFVLSVAKADPLALLQANLTLDLKAPVSTLRRARKFLFSARMPDAEIERVIAKLGNEALLAYIDLLFLDPVKSTIGTNVLVLGAEKDKAFPVEMTKHIASVYGTEAVIFPDMGHEMMIEPGWEQVADTITTWVAENFGAKTLSRREAA